MVNYKLPDNWDDLPVKEAVLGGVRKKIKVDTAIDTIYLLDENGYWTGEKATGQKKSADASETPSSETQHEKDNEAEQTEAKKSVKRKKQRKSFNPILLAIIAVLLIILVVQSFGGGTTSKQYEVVIAMENIHPGDTVAGKLSSATISAEEYDRYSKEGGLYTPEEYQAIKGFVATEFIAVDSCITYANVGESFQITNPWTMNVGNTITIPIEYTGNNLEDFLKNLMWGTTITLKIRAEVVIDQKDYPDASRPTSPEVEGESDLRYVQINDYTLKDFTIVDVLDANKKSLYASYAAMTAIPEPYQAECLAGRYQSQTDIDADMPAYIKIEVSEATVKWWERATKDSKITVTTSVTGVGCDTELENQTHQKLLGLVPKIISAWKSAGEGGN